MTETSKKNRTLSEAQQILRQKTASAVLSQDVRPEVLRRLEDLGRNYSRYPIPSTYLHSHSSELGARTQTWAPRTTTKSQSSDSQSNTEKWGYPDDSLDSFNPYHGGEKRFILYTNEIEPDDKYHLPADDDDEVYKSTWSDYFQKRSIFSTFGAIFMTFGLLCVFIIVPVLTFATNKFLPGDHTYNSTGWTGPAWAHVNDRTYGLLKNVRIGLIDPDTPTSAKTRKSTFDGSTLNLVFSDEFNKDNRTFYPRDDTFWTGADIWYGAMQDMEWYDPDAITTGEGTLQLRMDSFFQ
jgi:hypothetical protein